MARSKQMKLLKDMPKAYGGDLRKTREGRQGPRPLDTKNTIHLILRSSLAVGKWSFARKENRDKIERITRKFSQKYGVRVFSTANVGNHLHFQLKITNRYTYEPFIKAITAAIAMAITGASRWKTLAKMGVKRFWDNRPFTRVVIGFKAFLTLKNYIEINQLEGQGCNRAEAKMIIADSRINPWKYRPPAYI
jgi:hypothetical protein